MYLDKICQQPLQFLTTRRQFKDGGHNGSTFLSLCCVVKGSVGSEGESDKDEKENVEKVGKRKQERNKRVNGKKKKTALLSPQTTKEGEVQPQNANAIFFYSTQSDRLSIRCDAFAFVHSSVCSSKSVILTSMCFSTFPSCCCCSLRAWT